MSNRGMDGCKRVMWRLLEQGPMLKDGRYSLAQLRRSIMYECGVDGRTIEVRIGQLMELGWLKRTSRFAFIITGEHDDN